MAIHAHSTPVPAPQRGLLRAFAGSLTLPKSGDTPTPTGLVPPHDTHAAIEALLSAEPDTAAEARALHARRELHKALDFGFALLDALDLPLLALDVIDDAIADLDALDAPREDLEPSLGWTESGPRFCGDYQDCELDTADYEHSLGAPENHPGRWQIDMSGAYHTGRTRHPLGDQTHWSAGRPGDVEDDGDDREPEAGYDLACDEGELEEDGLSRGEHDTADVEPSIGWPNDFCAQLSAGRSEFVDLEEAAYV